MPAMFDPWIPFAAPPWRLSGAVYGVLLNDPAALATLGDAVHQPPYKAPPNAPVLYVKPRNTLAATGSATPVRPDVEAFELGASLGLVVGRTACRVREAQALSYLAGCTLVADLSVPHDSFYRPNVRNKARDGSCLVGPAVVPLASPDAATLHVRVDDRLVQAASMAGMIRPATSLLADVSEFMTLQPGDVLMLGVKAGAPRVRAGQCFSIEAEGLGVLEGRLVPASAEVAA